MQYRDSLCGVTTNIAILLSKIGSFSFASSLNQIKLTISASHTAAYSFDQALYDIELESETGVVTRLLQGKIKLSREVTK